MVAVHAHLLVLRPQHLPFPKANMERRAHKLYVIVRKLRIIPIRALFREVLRSSYNDDVDGACEGGGVDVLVVLVRGTDGRHSTPEVVHEDEAAGGGDGGRCAVQWSTPIRVRSVLTPHGVKHVSCHVNIHLPPSHHALFWASSVLQSDLQLVFKGLSYHSSIVTTDKYMVRFGWDHRQYMGKYR